MPRFYFDLAKARKSLATGETPWTPAVGVLFAMDVALEMLEDEGYEHIFARHAACAATAQAGLQALGFKLLRRPKPRITDGDRGVAARRRRLGRAEQGRCARAGWSWPAARTDWPDRSCASATLATCNRQPLSKPSRSSASRLPSWATTSTQALPSPRHAMPLNRQVVTSARRQPPSSGA